MSTPNPQKSASSLGHSVEIFATIAMCFMAVGIIAPVVGVNGLRLTGGPNGADAAITVAGDVNFDVDFGNPLPKSVGDDGTVTVFGQAPVELTAPTTTNVDFFDPTTSQRVIWLLWQVAGPFLGLLIAWPIRQMARSSRTGDPFTLANERRLWRIALLVAVGSVAYAMLAGMAKTLLIQRSAAADLFAIGATVDFTPVVGGVVIAALASVWRIGVAMREELDATI